MNPVSQGQSLWIDHIPLGPVAQHALSLLTQRLEHEGKTQQESALLHAQQVALTFIQWAGWLEDQLLSSDYEQYIAATILHHQYKGAEPYLQSTSLEKSVIELLQATQKLNSAASRKDLGNVLVEAQSLYRAAPIEMACQLHEILRAVETGVSEMEIRTLVEQTWSFHLPLSNRLGIRCAKRQLEDAILQIANQKLYGELDAWLEEKRRLDQNTGYSEQNKEKIERTFSAAGLGRVPVTVDWCSVAGAKRRLEKISSLDKRDSLQLYDLVTFLVHVDTVQECYQALAILHQIGPHWHGKIEDTLAQPKANGYSALETVITLSEERVGNIRIQTHAMADIAERGVLSRYLLSDEEQGTVGENFLHSSTGFAVRKLRESLKPAERKKELITVYTPRGEPRILPEGATALDFAYEIHRQIGYHAIYAEVNGVQVPLNHILRNGDVVQIIRDINSRPKEEWLQQKFVTTRKARNHLISQLNKQPTVRGRRLLEDALRRRDVSLDKDELDHYLNQLCVYLDYENPQSILLSIGTGARAAGFFAAQIAQILRRQSKGKKPFGPAIRDEDMSRFPESSPPPLKLCEACYPCYNKEIYGYLRRNRITVHTSDCRFLTKNDTNKLLPLTWKETPQSVIPVRLYISAIDRPGLARDVCETINRLRCAFKRIYAEGLPGGSAKVELSLEVVRLNTLEVLVTEIEKVRGVIEVTVDQKTLPPGTMLILSEKSPSSGNDSPAVKPPMSLLPHSLRMPYNPSLPCECDLFVGREREKEELMAWLVHNHGTALLMGPSRAGKTSLARNFLCRTRYESMCMLAPVDCRRRDWDKADVLYQMAYELFRVLKQKSKANESPHYDCFREEPETAFLAFLDSHEDFNSRFIFVLDEFELLVANHQVTGKPEASFFAFLRDLIQRHEKVSLLLIGSNRLPRRLDSLEKPGLWSELRGVPAIDLFPYLEEEGARRLAVHPLRNQGVEYTLAALDLVLDVTGCWPYHIGILGNDIVSMLNRNPSNKIEPHIVNEAIRDVTAPGRRDTYFQYLADEVTEPQARLLCELARLGRGSKPVSRSNLLNSLTKEDWDSCLQDLVDSYIIKERKVGKKQSYQFGVGLFGRWLYRKKRLK